MEKASLFLRLPLDLLAATCGHVHSVKWRYVLKQHCGRYKMLATTVSCRSVGLCVCVCVLCVRMCVCVRLCVDGGV